jgi:hypothetical protein
MNGRTLRIGRVEVEVSFQVRCDLIRLGFDREAFATQHSFDSARYLVNVVGIVEDSRQPHSYCASARSLYVWCPFTIWSTHGY